MKYLIYGVLALVIVPLLLLAPILGMLVDPWAPFRLQAADVRQVAGAPVVAVPYDPVTMPVVHGGVTDAFRYQLARAVNWPATDAILAVAISIAEDGSGDPAAVSPRNQNGTYDLGLWQINSSHWAEFGGQGALVDPFNNARAAHVIYGRQGWCAWSTYEPSCGPGHTGSYRAYLSRAQAASLVTLPPGQA